MWFGVLGPLLVGDGESVIGVPAARQRVLLAALLLRAGTVVPADALAEAVWDGAPPTGAETTLRSHVMRLRRVLGPAGARVVTRCPGYLIEAGEQEVDLLRFRRLYREGGAGGRAGEWGRAWAVLTEALGLWRGEPLADIPSEVLRRDAVPGLEELRVQAAEWRADAGLQLGRHGELVEELRSLAAEYPLRERFGGQLMLALVRCGRQAEALAAYQSARRVLVAELGTEPGAELRALHRRILAGDPTLAGSARAGDRPATVPRELPAPVAGFVGRGEELAALTALLDRSSGPTCAAIVISAIGGTAGVGKTALAVQWAHRAAERIPDGQLYVNLRGYGPDQPMTAGDALAGFLRALGVPGRDIPAEEDERAARYRSLLAGRQMLVLLDNAGSVEQVRPLLPGSPGCTVVVTSRDSLAGLVARDGAQRLDLDLLPMDQAVGLLRTLIGQRVDDDPGTTAMMAEQCCRLPLALRVAAELAASRPDVPLAELVRELADPHRRLNLLDAGGDPRTAVRAVFSWSYRHLNADAARAFRLLGLHPGADFEAYAAAALAGLSLEEARLVLDALARAYLIQATAPGRYGMHDLLRGYARELSVHDGEEQRASLTRLFDSYLYAAAAAMDILYPGERHTRPRIVQPASPTPPLTGPDEARARLDCERASLVAVAAYTAGHGWPSHAIRLAATLFRYLNLGGYFPEGIAIHTQALIAARRAGDRDAEATALSALGTIESSQARYQRATDSFRQALALFRRTGERTGQARVLGNLGLAYAYQGYCRAATGCYVQALEIFRQSGDKAGEVRTLCNLGIVEERQGLYQHAARHQEQSMAVAQDIGARDTEYLALVNLGIVSLRQGRYLQAAAQLRHALDLCRQTGYRAYEAVALTRIGEVCLRQGCPREAIDQLQQALALFREIGDPSGEADALNTLGEVSRATGQPREARARHAAALGLARQVGDGYEQARAHNGLGHAHRGTGDLSQARYNWKQALALFTEIGTPEADQVRAQLAAAGEDSPPEQEASPAR
jgi:DNA-binding SARP family transcriptional activator/tetratricopeptide (TPR) repeat protein